MEPQLLMQLIIDMTTVNQVSLLAFHLLESPCRQIMGNCRKIIEQIVNSINSAFVKSVDMVDGNGRWKGGGEETEV